MKEDGATYNYTYRRKVLIDYLRTKTDEGDWHGVSDAANDLRVLEAFHTAEQMFDRREKRSIHDFIEEPPPSR